MVNRGTMKRLLGVFAVAVMMLAMVGCNTEFEIDAVGVKDNTLSFRADVVTTRTALELTDKEWRTVWVGDETLVVSDGEREFEFKNSTTDKGLFVAEADGVRSLIGKSVNVVYNSGIDSYAGAAGMMLTGVTDNFSEESSINLVAENAFLKLTAESDVTLTADKAIFGDGVTTLTEVNIEAGENIFVAIYASENVRLTALVGGEEVKSATLDFVNNRVYNLGVITLSKPASYTLAYNNDADLWANTATVSVEVENAELDGAVAKYRKVGEELWHAAMLNGGVITIAPQYTAATNAGGRDFYAYTDGTGVYLGNSYEVSLEVDGVSVATTVFDAGGTADVLQDASMDNWSSHTVSGALVGGTINLPNADDSNAFWSSGNNKSTSSLCSAVSDVGEEGTYCAQLKGDSAFSVFAAGNLFAGIMEFGNLSNMGKGYARFGQPYTYNARPSALKLRLNATISTITHVGNNDPDESSITVGTTMDESRIMFALVSWNARHTIQSGTSIDASTFWSPLDADPSEGKVIGYGVADITQSTDGWVDLVIPACWYDTVTKPSGDYTLVISCAASKRGDYLTGSTNTVLLVENFEWVY